MDFEIINENIGFAGEYKENINGNMPLTEEFGFISNKNDGEVFFNEIIIKSSIKETLEANASIIDRNTHKTYTKTKIVTSYARYFNLKVVSRLTEDKSQYLEAIKWLKNEFASVSITAGKIWLKENKMPMKLGNKKLEDTTLVLNIGCSIFCISKNKGLCHLCGGCYAFSAELQYLNSLLYRIEQTIKFASLNAEEIAKQILNKAKRNLIYFVRFNEAGDVFDAEDILKMRKIAEIIYNKAGICTYTYSHRLDLNLKVFNTEYFKINISEIDFIASDTFENIDNCFFCCGICKRCVFCKFKVNKPVKCLKHGSLTGFDNRNAGVMYYSEIIREIYYLGWFLNKTGYSGDYIKI